MVALAHLPPTPKQPATATTNVAPTVMTKMPPPAVTLANCRDLLQQAHTRAPNKVSRDRFSKELL
jgi:hypothetical protein